MLEFGDDELQGISSIIPRLNVHHKQLFFADTPVFVEGIFDAQFIKSVQEFRGVSMEGSGSCVIDVGGNTEIAQYHKLIEAFGKKAIYIYDLDSVFTRSLRVNADTDIRIKEFLAKIGAGDEFQKYCGEFEKLITNFINELIEKDIIQPPLIELIKYLKKVLATTENDKHKKARVAFLIHLDRYRESLVEEFTEIKISSLEGKFNNIVSALKEQNVYLLKGGALEHYLPSYEGSIYQIDESKKRTSIQTELQVLFSSVREEQLSGRYGYLFKIISCLPSNKKVDFLKPLKGHLGKLIFKIQQGVLQGLIQNKDSIPSYIGKEWESFKRVLTIDSFTTNNDSFNCNITVQDKWGIGELIIKVDEKTNAGMGKYEITKK